MCVLSVSKEGIALTSKEIEKEGEKGVKGEGDFTAKAHCLRERAQSASLACMRREREEEEVEKMRCTECRRTMMAPLKMKPHRHAVDLFLSLASLAYWAHICFGYITEELLSLAPRSYSFVT